MNPPSTSPHEGTFLPSGLARPSTGQHGASCLFRLSMGEALARLSVSENDLRRWRTCGWLSFDWKIDDEVDEFDDPKLGEIELIRDITRSGMADARITRLLEKLPRPLNQRPDRLLYSFRHGWVVLDPPEPPDPAEVAEGYIAELTASGDRETLEELQARIAAALEETIDLHESSPLEPS